MSPLTFAGQQGCVEGTHLSLARQAAQINHLARLCKVADLEAIIVVNQGSMLRVSQTITCQTRVASCPQVWQPG